MASFVPSSEETLADQRRYTQERLAEVACQDCLARVLVKKNSEHHTAVQWTAEARASCQELSRRDTGPGRRDMHNPCTRLMASIDAAVRAGDVHVGAHDGY